MRKVKCLKIASATKIDGKLEDVSIQDLAKD